MNWLDLIIGGVAPQWGLQRARARLALKAYEAAKPSRTHAARRVTGSGTVQAGGASLSLREQARYLDENHDLASGVLDTLVKYVIGPNGIVVEPQPKLLDGSFATDLATELGALWQRWGLAPEVTGELDWVQAQHLAGRTLFRDGEVFSQLLSGRTPGLTHGSSVPFSLELLEPDFVPIDYDDLASRIVQGIQRDAWGRAKAYKVYKTHPGEGRWQSARDLKTVDAERMIHAKLVKRLHQARGISVFANVLIRLNDLKEYEESERVAARISAVLAAYIKKDGSYDDNENGKAPPRLIQMSPGMVIDDLRPGEDIGTIESNRPSVLLQPFRDAMLRAVAAGTGTTFSSLAKLYEGSYSSQRQELVEGYQGYQVVSALFVSRFVRPVYRQFAQMAITAGLVRVPPGINWGSVLDASYQAPAMIWIDPLKEASANRELRKAGFESTQNIIRARGKNPDDIKQQIIQDEKVNRAEGLVFSTSAQAPDPAPEKPDEEDQ